MTVEVANHDPEFDEVTGGTKAVAAPRDTDLPLPDVKLYGQDLDVSIANSVIDGSIERKIKGANQLKLTIADPHEKLIDSGIFDRVIDLRLDDSPDIGPSGDYYRLISAEPGEGQVELTFEPRTVALLRRHDKHVRASRNKITRAQFIRRLVKEVRHPVLDFVCPETKKEQPIDGTKTVKQVTKKTITDRKKVRRKKRRGGGGGLGLGNFVGTVKHRRASRSQRRVIQSVLHVGHVMGASRKVMISAIMTIIQESGALELRGGDRDSVGPFQQRASWGSFNSRRRASSSARKYYRQAIPYARAHPRAPTWVICQGVQRSAFPGAYRQWHGEAVRWVNAYRGGGGGGGGGGGTRTVTRKRTIKTTRRVDRRYAFTRGTSGSPENSWECMNRLAEEVDWALFAEGNTVYFISEEDLFKYGSVAHLRRRSPGVMSIEYSIDRRRNVEECKLNAEFTRYSFTPGSVVEIMEGPAKGRWLVDTVERDLFSVAGTVDLRRPLDELEEPQGEAPPAPDVKTTDKTKKKRRRRKSRPRRRRNKYRGFRNVKLRAAWGGSYSFFTGWVTRFMRHRGLHPGSQKRANRGTATGGISDHWVGSRKAYAIDYPTYHGQKIARDLSLAMGFHGWHPNTYQNFVFRHRTGRHFRVQILWGARIKHGDHVHVGIKRV